MLLVSIAPAVAVWQCRCYYMYKITYKCCVPLCQITLNFNDVRVTRAAFPFSVVRPAVTRPPARLAYVQFVFACFALLQLLPCMFGN